MNIKRGTEPPEEDGDREAPGAPVDGEPVVSGDPSPQPETMNVKQTRPNRMRSARGVDTVRSPRFAECRMGSVIITDSELRRNVLPSAGLLDGAAGRAEYS
jgi:hypothetical protein